MAPAAPVVESRSGRHRGSATRVCCRRAVEILGNARRQFTTSLTEAKYFSAPGRERGRGFRWATTPDHLKGTVLDDSLPHHADRRPADRFRGQAAPDFVGDTTFTYLSVDALGRGSRATVTISVMAVPEPSEHAMLIGGGMLLALMRKRRRTMQGTMAGEVSGTRGFPR
jgi:hypothetical protein